MNNSITCPKCKHEFSLGDLQEKLVKEKAIKMTNRWQQERAEEMELEKKTEIIKAVNEVTREQENKFKKQKEEKEELELKFQILSNQKQTDLDRIAAEAKKNHEVEMRLLELGYKEKANQDAKKIEKIQKDMDLIKNPSVSSQILGEVGENYVVEELESIYRLDNFIEIKKGEEGGDWIQEVCDENGTIYGKIYIESKNTKKFVKGWIPKLQQDMQDRNITTGVLISKNFPSNKQGEHSYIDQGIPIYKLDSNVFVSHIGLLRQTLIKLFVQAQLGEIENSDIPNKVFEYLNSDKYRNQVQQIAGILKAHSERIQDRIKTFSRYIKQDEKLLFDIVPLLIKTFKDDINEIASEEVLSLPELEKLEGVLIK